MSKRVLVTCGATWVAIDDVRILSNISTGQMGHLIAQAFIKKGARVTLIEGPVICSLKRPGMKVIKYRFFDELAKVLRAQLRKSYDIIIHAAAVSDFKPVKVYQGKTASVKNLILRLEPTEKLIDRIKTLSPKSCLVGFKLEPGLDRRNVFHSVDRLFRVSRCDWVVVNTLKNGYKGYIVNAKGQISSEADKKEKIANDLVNVLL